MQLALSYLAFQRIKLISVNIRQTVLCCFPPLLSSWLVFLPTYLIILKGKLLLVVVIGFPYSLISQYEVMPLALQSVYAVLNFVDAMHFVILDVWKIRYFFLFELRVTRNVWSEFRVPVPFEPIYGFRFHIYWLHKKGQCYLDMVTAAAFWVLWR